MWRLFVVYIEMYSLEEKIIEINQFKNIHHTFLIYCSRRPGEVDTEYVGGQGRRLSTLLLRVGLIWNLRIVRKPLQAFIDWNRLF
jgi:hypothetical protein